jgi:hypothetical protein
MKKTRPFIPYLFIAAFAFVFIRASEPVRPPPLPKGSTIYDTALAMLKEFVTECNDSNLGFSDFTELKYARIDTTKGIDLYYLREDSLLQSGLPIDSQLIDLHRRLYPVFVRDSLRSTITFQRTRFGWKPVAFDDGNIITEAIKKFPAQPGPENETVMLIEAPFVETELVREHSSTHNYFTPTPELLDVVGPETPLDTAKPHVHIDESLFLAALKTHLQYLHDH